MEKKAHFPAVDLLRGAAIASVLLYHGVIAYPINLRELYPWCDWLFRFLAAFHMPLFFLLSGFVYSCRNYGEYLKKRALRLLVPYIVFGAGSVFLHALAGGLVNGNDSILDGLVDLALYGSEYWFLYTLFVISAVFPLLDKIRAKWFLPAVIAVTVLIEPLPMPRAFILNKNFYYLGYFALGVLARRNLPLLSRWHAKIKERPALWVGASWALFVGVFSLMLKFLPSFAHREYIFALFGCGAVIVGCTAYNLPQKPQNFLKLCSRYSLQLYLLNGYFLVVGRTIIVSIAKIEQPLCIILGLFALSLLGGLVICKYILDRNNLFRVLSGMPAIPKETKKYAK